MKFTPEIPFAGGRVKPLLAQDIDGLFALYQQPELPGQAPLVDPEQLSRLVDISVKMAATQRGMMWAIEIDQPDSAPKILGMVSGFDWHASQLRITLRVDALPELSITQRQAALTVCMNFLETKYHVRNFAYPWIVGQNAEIKTMLTDLGYQSCAILRDAWRIGENAFADVHQFHYLSNTDKPIARRLGDDDQLGQVVNNQQGGAS
ncbi:MAG: hypothetical protein P1U57_14235 [Oleibacter sp.]|nr:hypothetical protein [Thalassolituus sp.]